MRGDVGKVSRTDFCRWKIASGSQPRRGVVAMRGTWMAATDGANVLVHFPQGNTPTEQRQVEVTGRIDCSRRSNAGWDILA